MVCILLECILVTTRKRSLGQGNIFIGMCQEFCSQGGGSLLPGGICSGGLQAHTQGGNWGGSGPGPHPRGKLRRIRSRPTPKGEIEEDQIQAHTQGGNWGGSDPGPHPRGKLRGIRSRPTPKGEIEGYEIQPPHDYCCGQYVSYWNAFLFKIYFWLFLCIEGNSHALLTRNYDGGSWPVQKLLLFHLMWIFCLYYAAENYGSLRKKCPAQIYLSCPEARTVVRFLF